MSDEKDWKLEQDEIDRLINNTSGTDVRPVKLEELTEGSGGGVSLEDLERLHDVTLPIRVVFGSVKKNLEQVLATKEGDIIKLDRFAGETVDIVVGDRIMAKGEITVVDGERFGVKIVEILPSGERIE
jgi:flagellar motor switch protein FliN